MNHSPSHSPPASPESAPRTGAPVGIIGGGVIGAACAFHLAEEGWSVVLIDQGRFGEGSSHGNCGYVSPSHILPLNKPGAVLRTLGTLFQKDSPFQLRPRLDPALWNWFWKFSRRCNLPQMLEAGSALHALLTSSRQIYDQLFERQVLTDCEWETRGLLNVHQSPATFEEFAATDRLLRDRYGVGATPIDEAELLKREPALKPGLAGAWLYDCDAHLRPDKLMAAWRRLLGQQGVAIREQCAFEGFEHENGAIRALRTSAGRIEVEQVVVATGAWTRLLKGELGRSLPIEPGKGYSITVQRPPNCPVFPMIFENHRVAVTPTASMLRIGSTMEFAGFDTSMRPERLNLLTSAARRYLCDPLPEPYVESWYGWRPMSCDGVPIIGRLPDFRNGWVAAGHSMLGVSLATGTGKLIGELLSGRHPHVDPHPYRVDRFA